MAIEFSYADTASHALLDISAMSYIQNGNFAFLYFASAIDDGIDIFSLNQSGVLNHIDTIQPFETSGFDAIQDMLTFEVEGKGYLISAAAGTNSITSFLVHQSGNLFEQDMLIDDLSTRFEGVTDIDHVRDGWRDFIIAAGADDGITIFEFYANGTMRVVAVIEDDFGTALNNVSAVAAALVNGTIQILVGSDTEHGISQFEFTPDVFVNRYIANNIAPPDGSFNVTIGSKFNDQIFGQQLSDHLKGGKGDDIIDGGDSRDWLRGGPGADQFVFNPDGSADQIDDYELGIDVIDISGYALVNDLSDIEIESRRWGSVITVNGEMIIVKTVDLTRIEVHEWTVDDFIF